LRRCEQLGAASRRSSRETAKMGNLVSYTLSMENNRSRVADDDLQEEDDGGGEISKFVRTIEQK
jgi:hypothetical protein